MKKKILIIKSRSYPKNFDRYLNKISNCKITIVKEDKKEIIQNLKNMNALINCPRRFFDVDILKNGKNLKWVHSGGAGVEDYLFKELFNQNNKEALDYLKKRGLNENTIEEFKLGYVPWKNNFYQNLL